MTVKSTQAIERYNTEETQLAPPAGRCTPGRGRQYFCTDMQVGHFT